MGLAATGLALAAGAYAFGPGAPLLVEALADGRSVWRLGTLEVEEVQGAWIGDLTARSVTLSDAEGVWLEARNLRLRWSPVALLTGQVRIDEVMVPDAVALRTPELNAPPRSRGLRLSLSASHITVQSLRIAEEAAGVDARISISAALDVRAGSLQMLRVQAARVDLGADRAVARFEAGTARPWTIEAEGAPGGLLANLLGASEAVALTGQAVASGGAGEGSARLVIGEETALEAQVRWSEGAWRAEGSFDPKAAPLLPLAHRLGGAGRLEASGEDGGALQVRLEAPALTASLAGDWNGPMQLRAETLNPEAVLGLDRPLADRIEAQGVFRRSARGGRFSGRASVFGLTLGGFRGDGEGPVAISFNRERIEVTATAAAQGGVERFAVTEAEGSVVYGRQTQTLVIRRFLLEGPVIRVEAQGVPERLTGTARLADLSLIAPQASGVFDARFEIGREGEIWRILGEGEASQARFPGPGAELLGPRPRLSFSGLVTGGDLVVQRVTLMGDRLRLGARGRLNQDNLDLVWEASGRGPARFAGVGVSGALDASGRALGRPEAPRITGVGRLAALDLGAVTLAPAQVRFAYAEGAGAVALSALYGGHPLMATGDVIVRERSVLIEGLRAELIGLSAEGSLEVTDGSLSGSFDLNGPLVGLTGQSGSIVAALTLSGTGGRLVADARGHLRDAMLGGARISQASFTASGPLQALGFDARWEGTAWETPFRLEAEGTASIEEGGMALTASLQGTAAGLEVRSLEPIVAMRRGEAQSAAGSVSIGGGSAAFTWLKQGDALTASLEAQSLSMAAFSGFTGEPHEGVVSGRAAFRSLQGRLAGEADFSASGFRVRGRMRSPVDLRLSGRLGDDTISALVSATSEEGLQARVDLSADLATQASPLRIGLAPGSLGRAAWSVRGPADMVWALAGTPDQSVSGDLSGSGEARFGPGTLSGSGALALRGGVFEDRLSGVRLRDVSFDVRLSDELAVLEALSATDGRGGRLSGSGSMDAAQAGSLQLRLDNLYFVDREEATARADGDLAFGWSPSGALLSGELRLREATIRGALAGARDIPRLEVIEINRPEGVSVATSQALGRRGLPTEASLRVRAPSRAFTRFRGVDAEWSLDLLVAGDISAPELAGEARLLRGEAQLAGRPLIFSRGAVRFRGPLMDAELDIVAEQETPDLTARVVLSGTVGAPEIRLENDQGLPEDETAPLLLFGATQAELSALQAAQLASRLSALTGGSAFDFVDLTRRIAGLDRFDIRTEEDGVLVSGGRYLTRQVYVELGRNGLGEAQTRMEWLLRPDLTLITSFSGDREQRVSLRWREEDEEDEAR